MLKIYGWIIVFIFSNSSLNAQYHYIANNDISNLVFENQGEIKLGISFPFEGQTNFQLGYSPLKNINIAAAFHGYKNAISQSGFRRTDLSNTSYIGAIGLYRSLKNPFTSNFLIFKNLKKVVIQTHFGYSFNKNRNQFSRIPFHYIDNNSQSLFFRINFALKYRNFSMGMSRQFLTVHYTDADVVGDFFYNQVAIDRFETIINDFDNHKLRDFSIYLKYRIKSFETFVEIHSITRPSFNYFRPFFEREYYNMGVIINFDTLFKFGKKDNEETY